MLIRLRFSRGPKVLRKRDSSRHVALALASLLTPAALMALALALWRLGTDLKWTGPFAISTGIFSHWQTWIASAIGLFAMAAYLNRYGHAGAQKSKEEPPALFQAASSEK